MGQYLAQFLWEGSFSGVAQWGDVFERETKGFTFKNISKTSPKLPTHKLLMEATSRTSMGALVIVDLNGDLHQGITVTMEIRADGDACHHAILVALHARTRGRLPPAPHLDEQYRQWRSLYHNLSVLFRLGDRPNAVTRGSRADLIAACRQSAQVLTDGLNIWLAADSFRAVREQFLEKLSPTTSIRLILQADDNQLRRLPWHGWDVLQRYPHAEISLSAPAYERVEVSTPPGERARILVVLGDRSGIDIESDRQLLATLPGRAETLFLVEPDRQQLHQKLWDPVGWDILFFAGHSGSQRDGENGYIGLNRDDRLSIDELTYALRRAIAHGLKLAIFNSCDGLGLAHHLERLHIPQMIVMREPIPDRVAQEFLKQFLTHFSAGQPLYTAVRDAREHLQSLEDQYPCATWLPIICQNPTEEPLSWHSLFSTPPSPSLFPSAPLPFPPSSPPPCPYRGLSAFQEADAGYFFGRDEIAIKLAETVHHRSLVAVIGPSGSGKSSLVFAGLIPRLRSQGDWLVVSFRPGNRPFIRLAEQLIPLLEPGLSETDQLVEMNKLAIALQQGGLSLSDVIERIGQKYPLATRLLLVVDQFEELYTLCQNSEERQRFQDVLLAVVNPHPSRSNIPRTTPTLAFTLRADFCEYALAYRPLAEALRQCPPELLGPMTRAELRTAVEKPALQLGVRYADGLIERILDAIDQAPGHLPLLEFALTLLWERQEQGCLTHAAYEAIGGVEQALAGYAEQVYQALDASTQRQAQRIFTQLVRPGEGTADTRRLAIRSELGNETWRLVPHLADVRLVVSRQDEATGEDIVELAHEALIQEWQRLRQWLDDDRSFRTWQERLRGMVRQWETNGQDEGALLRGAPLVEAQHWFQERQIDLSQLEQQFIETSLALKARDRAMRDRQRRYRIIGLSSGITAALLLAAVATWQWNRAEIVQANAQLDALSASTDELLASGKELEALLAGLRAGKQVSYLRNVNPDTRTHVITSLQQVVYGIREYNRLNGHDRTVIDVSFSPDGQWIASASDDTTVKIWRQDGTLEVTLTGHGDRVRSVSFSPDGEILASASYDSTIRLWQRDGRAIAVLRGHSNKVNSVSFSADGQLLASASADGSVKLWQRVHSEQGVEFRLYATLLGHQGWVQSVRFSPDGQLLASAGSDGTVKLWQLNGALIATLRGPQVSINGISFSPDGQTLAAATKSGTVWLWQRQGSMFAAAPARVLEGHTDRVWGVSFSPDGRLLASASADNTVKLWQQDGTLVAILEGHNSSVYGVRFSPDGNTLASASADSTVKLWHPNRQSLTLLQAYPTAINDLSFSPDGQALVTANEAIAHVWRSPSNPTLPDTPAHGGQDVETAWRWADLATATCLDTSQPECGLRSFALRGHQERVSSVSIHPDGNQLATASEDGTVKLWMMDGTLVQTLMGHQSGVLVVRFSPDNQYLASADETGKVNLWQQDSQGVFQLKQTLIGEGRVTSLSFSSAGQFLASSSDDTVTLWRQAQGKFDTNPYRILVHSSRVTHVSFSQNGQMLGSATADGNAMLWRRDGTLLATLRGHRDRINSIIFSPDDQTIATASADETVKLWNLTGILLRTLKGHVNGAEALSFGPDGHLLAAASGDGQVILWNFNLQDLVDQGCTWIGDYLQTNPELTEGDRTLCLPD